MTSADARLLTDIRKQSADLGPLMERCRDAGQISAAVHMVKARDALALALDNYKPGRDERSLELLPA